MNFSPGDLVRARGREWVVLPSSVDNLLAIRPLSGADSDSQVIAPGLEAVPVSPRSNRPTTMPTGVPSAEAEDRMTIPQNYFAPV